MINPLRYKDLLNNKNRRPFNLKHIIAMPLIFSGVVIIPFVDLWLEIYHRICFPLYGLKYIKRSKYIKIDRHKLSKLSLFEKFGCIYCGYANGWVLFASKIFQETERFSCGIKHQKLSGYETQKYQETFSSRKDYK